SPLRWAPSELADRDFHDGWSARRVARFTVRTARRWQPLQQSIRAASHLTPFKQSARWVFVNVVENQLAHGATRSVWSQHGAGRPWAHVLGPQNQRPSKVASDGVMN